MTFISLEKSIKQSLLALVRLGIGHSVSFIPETIDWEAIRALASEQGLSAIVLDGAQALMDRGELVGGRVMDVKLKKHWIGSVIQNSEWKYNDYRKRLGQLAGLYNNHGFRLMVLKGYGLGLNYPRPEHRPCGDIDIWAFGEYKEADAMISKELGISVNDSHHHHTTFSFKGYLVENHYDFVNVHYGHKNAELEMIFKKLADDDSLKTEIDGQILYLPSPNLNALFLLRHTVLHFASTSMILRQILDWGFFVKKYSAEIDWAWLMEILDEYHMDGFFACLNAICVDDLGFDAALFPLFQTDERLKERVLNDTLSPEFSEKQPVGFMKRIQFKYRRWNANKWKQDLCYGDSRFWSFFVSFWSHVIKPSMI